MELEQVNSRTIPGVRPTAERVEGRRICFF